MNAPKLRLVFSACKIAYFWLDASHKLTMPCILTASLFYPHTVFVQMEVQASIFSKSFGPGFCLSQASIRNCKKELICNQSWLASICAHAELFLEGTSCEKPPCSQFGLVQRCPSLSLLSWLFCVHSISLARGRSMQHNFLGHCYCSRDSSQSQHRCCVQFVTKVCTSVSVCAFWASIWTWPLLKNCCLDPSASLRALGSISAQLLYRQIWYARACMLYMVPQGLIHLPCPA